MTGAETDLSIVRDLVREAGGRVMELLLSPLVTSRKADHSLVTNADHAANDLLCAGLRRRFPGYGVLSEETGLEGPPGAEFLWVIDPLDGTRAYAKGLPGFSVMVGLLRNGQPEAGVVYDPMTETLFEAARGQGTFRWRGRVRTPLRVSDRREWGAMPVITSRGFPPALRLALEKSGGLRFLEPINSVGIKVGYLVDGRADLYLNHHPVHLWDTCAPLVILEEAGGRMTHWDGTPLSYVLDGRYAHSQATVATNGPRHDDLIALLPGLART